MKRQLKSFAQLSAVTLLFSCNQQTKKEDVTTASLTTDAQKQIRGKSPILKELEDNGEIKITDAFYRLTDGTSEFID
ncbi:MAG: hypothetical protein ABI760_13205 [Ferruginibacter sp.]